MALTEIPKELSSTPGIVDNSNATAITIDASENVGIGTSLPQAKLDVSGVGNFSTAYGTFTGDGLHIQSNGTGGAGAFTGGISFSRISADNNSRAAGIAGVQGADADQVGLAFFTHPSAVTTDSLQEAMRIDASGNVGIGVSVPTMPLDVAGACSDGGNTGANVNQTLYDTTSYALGVGGGIGFAGKAGSGSNLFDVMFATINGIKENANNADYSSALTFKTRVSGSGLTERMRIDSSGNVGIGTVPAADLHVADGADSNAQIRINGSTSTVYSRIYSDNNGVLAIGTDGGNQVAGSNIRFEVKGTERMRIDANGHVIVKNGGRFYLESSSGFSPFLSESSNDLLFTVNNGERMRIDSNGTVKISHADTASEGLRVIQTTAARTSGGALALIYDDQGGTTQPTFVVQQNGTGDILQLFDGAAQVVTVVNGGNVGIGVTNPDTKLEVRNPTQATDTVNTLLTQRWSRAQTAAVKWGNSMDLLLGSYESGTINSRTRVDFKLANGATDDPDTTVMTLQGNGNVGIGTSTPSDTYNYGRALDLQSSTGAAVYLRDSDNTSNFGLASYDSGENRCVIGGGGTAYLRFISAGTECGRFDGSGNLLVSGISLTEDDHWHTKDGTCYSYRASGVGRVHNQFFNAGSLRGEITSSPGGATLYTSLSDSRVKENITDAVDAGSTIDALQVRQFDMIGGAHHDYGMVAQELALVCPDSVYQPEDPEKMMSVDYSKLVPMLVKEIQSLRARVAQLES